MSEMLVRAATTPSRPLPLLSAISHFLQVVSRTSHPAIVPLPATSSLLMIAARSLAAPSGAPPRGGVHRLPPAVRLPRTGHVVGPCRHAAREVLRRSFQMAHRVTFIPGDGVGPELSEATRRVLEGTGVDFDWDVQEAGADVIEKYGTPLPEPVLESIRANGVAIKGPLTTPIGTGFRSVNVALRKELDLFACLRPCKSYPGVRSRYDDVDVVIVRENTEDLYAGTRGRRKVTAVHKANIMKFSDGLFLQTAREVAEEYPDVAFEDRIVDNLCMQLVQRPEEYDVLVLPNLYGDIVSDLCA